MSNEETIIRLLKQVVKKQNECLILMSEITGTSAKEVTAEEGKRYMDYVRKRIYSQ